MRSRSGRKTNTTTAAVLSGLLALGSAGAAFAQGSDSKPPAASKSSEPHKRNDAKKIFKEAEAKFEKGDYAGALPLYRQADAITPNPMPKYKIALCLDKSGQASEAVAAWQAFLDAKPEGDKFKDKIPEAQKRIEELKKTPAKVKVATVPESPPNVKITVDDAMQSGRELSLPPGKHKVVVSADGYAPMSEEVTVGFAETREMSFSLTAPSPAPIAAGEPPPSGPPASPPAATPAAPPAPPSEPRSPIPAYVSFGLAGAGVVMGTLFGIMAISAKSTYDDDKTTENADKVDTKSTIADISFASAVGFGAAGVVLLLTEDTPEPAKAAATRPGKRAFVAPYVGPTGAGAAARLTF